MRSKAPGKNTNNRREHKRSCSISKHVIACALSSALVLTSGAFAACSPSSGNDQGSATKSAADAAIPAVTGTVSKDPKYDCAQTSFTAEDLEAAGFQLGDTVDISFGNGFTLSDVPYFNGYYVKTGDPVLVAYPNNEFVLIAYNNGQLWTKSKLEDGTGVTITLNAAGEEAATQEALGQVYSTDRDDYASDEQFSNFRALTGGNLKQDFLYRGASPVDNSRNRAAITDGLLKNSGIKSIIDLADSDDDIQSYFAAADFDSPYAQSLYEAGDTVTLAMSSSYGTDEYRAGVAKGFRFLIKHGGPAYIHCMEGKDRTGFVCMLLESLAGAGYDEMLADYMKTYENYYGITKDGTPDRYEAVSSLYFATFAEFLLGVPEGSDLQNGDYATAARNYLLDAGMTNKEIDRLTALICK